MDNNIENTKDLNINGVIYAKYQIENDMIFINVQKNIIKDNAGESEDYLVFLISMIEDKQFSSAGYLNI